MKTTTTKSALKAILTAIVFMIFLSDLSAQKSGFNFNAHYRVSGNGLGAFIIPQLGYKIKSHEIMVGPSIQKRNLHVSGLDMRYTYNLPKMGNSEFFLFLDVNYLNNAYLGKCYVRMESFVKPEYASFYQTVRMNVIEEHAGFGIKFLKTNNFNCYALIGAGGFQTLGACSTNLFRIRDQFGSSLLIGLGLNLKIRNTRK